MGVWGGVGWGGGGVWSLEEMRVWRGLGCVCAVLRGVWGACALQPSTVTGFRPSIERLFIHICYLYIYLLLCMNQSLFRLFLFSNWCTYNEVHGISVPQYSISTKQYLAGFCASNNFDLNSFYWSIYLICCSELILQLHNYCEIRLINTFNLTLLSYSNNKIVKNIKDSIVNKSLEVA